MKPFSKEWWLELATVEHEFLRCKRGWANDWLTLTKDQKQYCAKRYAEAYHREKMKEGINQEINQVGLVAYNSGTLKERDRILDIIDNSENIYPNDLIFEEVQYRQGFIDGVDAVRNEIEKRIQEVGNVFDNKELIK